MWQLSGTVADWSIPRLSARVDLNSPGNGVHEIRVDSRALTGVNLLGVSSPGQDRAPPLADAYVRQADLIATYAEAPPNQVRRQLYWRGFTSAPHQLGGCELIVSVQTSLLDSDPNLSVTSTLPAAEVLLLEHQDHSRFVRFDRSADAAAQEIGSGAILFRLQGAECSYLQMIFPGDASHTVLSSPSEAPQAWHLSNPLFPESLEKGVIRRGRIRGLFLSRANDEAAALAAYEEFVVSPLPLTT